MNLKNFDWSRLWDDKCFYESKYIYLNRSRFDDFHLGIQVTNVGIWIHIGWFHLDIGFYTYDDL